MSKCKGECKAQASAEVGVTSHLLGGSYSGTGALQPCREAHLQSPTGRSWDRASFTLQPLSNKRPPMTHGQERHTVLASGECLSQDHGGLVLLGYSVLLATVPNILSIRPSIN